MRKTLAALLAALLLPLGASAADRIPAPVEPPEAPAVSAEGLSPLPLNVPAPYAPQGEASADSYTDGSITVRTRVIRLFETNITVAWIEVADPSQLRTALAAPYPAKRRATALKQAQQNKAVFALSGDFFSYHSEGYVVRGGKLLRNKPTRKRDTLLIDGSGYFSILHPTTKAALAEQGTNVREAFAFGPWLVSGGEIHTNYRDIGLDVDPNGRHIRLVIGQRGPLSYVVFSSEGPEHRKSLGLTIRQCALVAQALGCTEAYNLDGGSSATLILNGRAIHSQVKKYGMRAVGDIIYFATLIP